MALGVVGERRWRSRAWEVVVVVGRWRSRALMVGCWRSRALGDWRSWALGVVEVVVGRMKVEEAEGCLLLLV